MQDTDLNGSAAARWKDAWKNRAFRTKLTSGFVLLILWLNLLPPFFDFVEARQGYDLHDFMLRLLPSVDVSRFIFALIWASTLLTIARTIPKPYLFLAGLWTYLFLGFVRAFTILLAPLSTPPGLIPLMDPISNHFYPGRFITKDLFFSGHTSTLCMMFLFMRKKLDRILIAAATILLGILLLVQHVHYSIDVLGAPVFAYGCYRLGMWFVYSSPNKRSAGATAAHLNNNRVR